MAKRILSLIFCSCILVGVIIPYASAKMGQDPSQLVSFPVDQLPFSTSSPWCVRFARWVSMTCYDVPESYLSPSDSCSGSINYYSRFGVPLVHYPITGYWVYFDWEKDGIPDHVGVCTWTDGYNIKSIEGNVNDSIYERSFTLDSDFVFGFTGNLLSSSNTRSRFSSPAALDPSEDVDVVSPVTPSKANGFKAVLLGLIGDYEPIVVEHRYTNSSGYTSVNIEISPDYVWWAGCAIVALCIWSLFRLLGGFSKRG